MTEETLEQSESVSLPHIEIVSRAPASEDAPRRRGRPPGSKNRPKDVQPGDAAFADDLPVRRRGRPPGQKLTPKQVSDLALMAHTLAAQSLGPSAAISEEQAEALGEAIVPVLEDFGVRVASKVVHLVVLVTTLAMVEGPVLVGVARDAQARVTQQRVQAQTNASVPRPPASNGQVAPNLQSPVDIAQWRGIEVGAPNVEGSV